MTGVLLGVGLSSALMAGLLTLRAGSAPRLESPPVLTLLCLAVIAAVSLVQLAMAPGLLPLLMRDGLRTAVGQPWRLATSLLVQDGGWGGAFFNLVGLLSVGTVMERLLGRMRWVVVAGASVGVAQAFGLLWQPTGAGNSILNFGLAGAVCAASLTNRAAGQAMTSAIIASAAFVILAAARDIHGAAALTGALVQLATPSAGRHGAPGRAA